MNIKCAFHRHIFWKPEQLISLYLLQSSVYSIAWSTFVLYSFYHAYQFDWGYNLGSEYLGQLKRLTQSSAVTIKVVYTCLQPFPRK